jgi:hypothetical protein
MTTLFGLFGLILSSCFSFVPALGTVKESLNIDVKLLKPKSVYGIIGLASLMNINRIFQIGRLSVLLATASPL